MDSYSHTICGVCSKFYNDPRILACLHSCQQSLDHEVWKSGSQQVQSGLDDTEKSHLKDTENKAHSLLFK